MSILTKELFGRLYGGGSGPVKTEGIDIEKLLLIDPQKIKKEDKAKIEKSFTKLANREIMTVFDEVRQQDRLNLDGIFFDILGLTKKEKQEVYDAVCELVRNRLEKAKTFGKKGKNKREEFNPTTYAEHILAEVFPLGSDRVKKEFPKDFIDCSWSVVTIKLPEIEESSKLVIEEFFGKASLRIDGKTVDCGSTPKARFVELAIEKGAKDKVDVPTEDKWAIKAVNDYLKYKEGIKKEIEDTISLFNLNLKKEKAVWSELEKKI
jgi:hypothetical protein